MKSLGGQSLMGVHDIKLCLIWKQRLWSILGGSRGSSKRVVLTYDIELVYTKQNSNTWHVFGLELHPNEVDLHVPVEAVDNSINRTSSSHTHRQEKDESTEL